MGLLDVLNGMQNGPRGNPIPSPSSDSSGGGMSKITMAVLGLLAYKAIKGFTSQPSAGAAAPARPAGAAPEAGTGGLGDLLGGGLGSVLGGGAAGSVLSGGLKDLLSQFQRSGQGDVADSWVGTGANRAISHEGLSKALSDDQIRMMMAQTGMSRDELLAALSAHLPEAINRMTPNGRVPAAQELSRLL
jgi:uncharacterized protein YidB (DUF937 family)